ncbi:MAG: nitroreductase family deazaflavin-dependent oxidoreductase [Chloroflexi bacterium]|nr:nitroreductase family deazaflavin-dependent oxidoreductase [Chloroflexota bacterium]
MSTQTLIHTPPLWERGMKYLNPFVVGLLRSPLHGLVSNHLLVITVRGRKSGKLYHAPVEYHQDGNQIVVISEARRVWWRNLLGDADVMLHLRGFDVHAVGSVITDPVAVSNAAIEIFHFSPVRAMEFAEKKVLLRLRLSAVPMGHAS